MVPPATQKRASDSKVSGSVIHLLTPLFLSLSVMQAAAAPRCNASGPVKPTAPLLSFLQRLQSAALATLGPDGFDAKLYVDVPLKTDLAATEEAFARLPRPGGVIPASDLERFLGGYFGEAGSDLVYAEPEDFVAEPEWFLPKVENPKVRAWALEVHSLWKNLTRMVSNEVRERPELHTLLPLPGRAVVPGSRFREVYYWDSYWSISKMGWDGIGTSHPTSLPFLSLMNLIPSNKYESTIAPFLLAGQNACLRPCEALQRSSLLPPAPPVRRSRRPWPR